MLYDNMSCDITNCFPLTPVRDTQRFVSVTSHCTLVHIHEETIYIDTSTNRAPSFTHTINLSFPQTALFFVAVRIGKFYDVEYEKPQHLEG